MSEKIIDMIVQLVNTGSSSALWFYGIYIGGSVLKFMIGFVCAFIGLKYFCKTLTVLLGDK